VAEAGVGAAAGARSALFIGLETAPRAPVEAVNLRARGGRCPRVRTRRQHASASPPRSASIASATSLSTIPTTAIAWQATKCRSSRGARSACHSARSSYSPAFVRRSSPTLTRDAPDPAPSAARGRPAGAGSARYRERSGPCYRSAACQRRSAVARVRIPYALLSPAWLSGTRMVERVRCAGGAGKARRVRTPVRTSGGRGAVG
jgi:hypothetical protein